MKTILRIVKYVSLSHTIDIFDKTSFNSACSVCKFETASTLS